MRPVDVRSYAAAPTGCYTTAPRGLVFCARPSLWGFALWGKPSEADARRIVQLLAYELAAGVPPHASLIDVRRLEAGDPRAFAVFAGYLRRNWTAFRTRVTRVALVRPPGLLGAMVAGFYQLERAPYPVRVFDDLAAAAAWSRAPRLAAELDVAIAETSTIAPIVLALRGWLDTHLTEASLSFAAKALGRAPRSLQRDLERAGSYFQRELDAARLRMAKRLLADTDASLTEIAYDVGCASPQHFSTLFKNLEGISPSGWRARATENDNAAGEPTAGARPEAKRVTGSRGT